MTDGAEQSKGAGQDRPGFEDIARQLPDEKLRQIGRMLFPHPDIIPILAETFGADSYPTNYLASLYEDRDSWASEQFADFRTLLDRMAPFFFKDKIGLFNTQEENDAFQRLVEQEVREEAAAEGVEPDYGGEIRGWNESH